MENREFWSGWETVRPIGSGRSGMLYEIRNRETGQRAAMRLISVSREQLDMDRLAADGYDLDAIKARQQDTFHKVLTAYQTYQQLSSHPNLVDCEEVGFEQDGDGIGWRVFARMAYLPTLAQTLDNEYNEARVIKLCQDISFALAIYRGRGGIPWNIRPENIFVAANGDYQLGDFGAENALGETEKTIAPEQADFVAPEVYANQPYGSQMDVYALGMVMYWMMNGKRGPFLPQPPIQIGQQNREEARQRRFRGEALPAPAHGSDALKAVVLKACANDPARRYPLPIELMQAAVNSAQAEPVPVNPEPAVQPVDLDVHRTWKFTPATLPAGKTVDIQLGDRKVSVPMPAKLTNGQVLRLTGLGREDPATGKRGDLCVTIEVAGAAAPAPKKEKKKEKKPEKKKKKGGVIAIVAILAVLLCAGSALLVIFWGDLFPADGDAGGSKVQNSGGQKDDDPDVGGEDPETPTFEDEDEQDAYDEAVEYCDELAESGDYLGALRYLESAMEEADDTEPYEALIAEYQGMLEEQVLSEAREFADAGKYDQAIQVITQMQADYNCEAFETELASYMEAMRVPLTSLSCTISSNTAGSTKDVNTGDWPDVFGNVHTAALKFWTIQRAGYTDLEYISYALDGKYTALAGSIVASSESDSGAAAKVKIFVDGAMVYESPLITTTTEETAFEVDLTGAEELRIVSTTDQDAFSHCIVDASLTESAAVPADTGLEIQETATIGSGRRHTAVLRSDGTVAAVGGNEYGQLNVSSWTNIIAVGAGDHHTVGLKSDGTVVAVGKNDDGSGQCNVYGWTDVVAISAGDYHTVGLRSDGTLVATGRNTYGQCDVSNLMSQVKDGAHIVSIACGYEQTVALMSDGTVAAIGRNNYGQCNVSSWNGVVAIWCGTEHTVGLRADGSVVATGLNDYGQLNTSGWSGLVTLSAGDYFTVGLMPDGTLLTVGHNKYGQCNVSSWTDIVVIGAGSGHFVARTADGTMIALGWNEDGQCNVSGLYY